MVCAIVILESWEINKGCLNVTMIVITDADNTLWDTDKLFADAQVGLLQDVRNSIGLPAVEYTSDLEFVREIDQAIAERQGRLNYPPKLLVIEVASALKAGTDLKGGVVDSIVSAYVSRIGKCPVLRRGVKNGIEELSRLSKLCVLTESSLSICRGRAHALGIDGNIEFIRSVVKSPDEFSKTAELACANDEDLVVVVGDQLDRDIQFGREVGFTTIYFPGGFKPRWVPSESDASPDYTISSYDEVAGILKSLM